MNEQLFAARALRVALWLVKAGNLDNGMFDPTQALKAILERAHVDYGDELQRAPFAFPSTLHFYRAIWCAVRPEAQRHSPLRLCRLMMGVRFGEADAIWLHWLGRAPASADEAAAVAVWELTYSALKARCRTLERPQRRVSAYDSAPQACYAADTWYFEVYETTDAPRVDAPKAICLEEQIHAAFARELRAAHCADSFESVAATWFGGVEAVYRLLQDCENPLTRVRDWAFKISVWQRALRNVCRAAELDVVTVLNESPPPPPERVVDDDFERTVDEWISRCVNVLARYESVSYAPIETPLQPVRTAVESVETDERAQPVYAVLENSAFAQTLGAARRVSLVAHSAPCIPYMGAGALVFSPPDASFAQSYTRLLALRHHIDALANTRVCFITLDLQRALIRVIAALKRFDAVWCIPPVPEPIEAVRNRLIAAMSERGVARSDMRAVFKAATGYDTLEQAERAGLPLMYVESAVCYYLLTQPR